MKLFKLLFALITITVFSLDVNAQTDARYIGKDGSMIINDKAGNVEYGQTESGEIYVQTTTGENSGARYFLTKEGICYKIIGLYPKTKIGDLYKKLKENDNIVKQKKDKFYSIKHEVYFYIFIPKDTDRFSVIISKKDKDL